MLNIKDLDFASLNQLCKNQNGSDWESAWEEINHRIKLAQDGDEEMVMAIVNSMMGIVKKMAYQFSKSCNISDYDDLISYGTLGILKAIKMYDPEKRCLFSKLAFIQIKGSITQHTSQEFRHCDKRPVSITNDFCDNDKNAPTSHSIPESFIMDNSKDPFEQLSLKMNMEVVNEAIKTLTPKQREAFILQHVKQMKQQEVADMLGVSYAVMNTRSHVAKEKIKVYCKNRINL